MGKPNLLLLLDGSSSMTSRVPFVVPQVNFYLAELAAAKAVKNAEIWMFYSRDDSFYGLTGNVPIPRPQPRHTLLPIRGKTPIADLRPLSLEEYDVGGMTPLYDALGNLIVDRIDNKRPTLFVTMTDGAENASSEFNLDELNTLIRRAEDKGCRFLHLGEGIQGKGQMAQLHGAKVYWEAANSGVGYARAAFFTQTMADGGTVPEETDV